MNRYLNGLLLIGVTLLQAPGVSKPLAFEVVSIKAAAPVRTGGGSGCHGVDTKLRPNDPRTTVPVGHCVAPVARLSTIINQSFGLMAIGAIKGLPDWDNASLYAIDGKAEDPSKATEAQLWEMMQTLLADRFRLKYHREPQMVQGFELIADKRGAKIEKSTLEGAEEFSLTSNNPPGMGVFDAKKISMETMVKNLSTVNLCIGERGSVSPVVDRTGLAGYFAFKLTWDICRAENIDGDRSIRFTIKDQIGLDFQPAKVPFSFFIVDSAEKPSLN